MTMPPLYGIGVGPGDPELMTLKAHRLISQAEVIAYPAPDSGESFARRIAASAIPEDALELPIVIPMRTERFPAQEIYDQAAENLRAHMLAGRRCVVLCEGDPFFYGSFMYLFARLSADLPCEIVPGVNSLAAVTAAASRPLCARADVLTVLPATLPEAELEARLTATNAAAIMKLGRHFPKIRALLTRLGLAERAVFVSHASLPNQQVWPLSEAPDEAPYFSMILIPGEDAHV
ncbi:MAG: precorrin-2 C(20)-methyltransferase [Mangrovicoccus sp.]